MQRRFVCYSCGYFFWNEEQPDNCPICAGNFFAECEKDIPPERDVKAYQKEILKELDI